MKSTKILLTSCGCPGSPALISALRSNGERTIVIVGTDVDSEAAERFSCDYFYTVPEANAPTYLAEMLEIVDTERPFVILPGNDTEAEVLSQNVVAFQYRNAEVLTSKPEVIAVCNDKWRTYLALNGSTDVKFPQQYLVKTLDRFTWALAELGYPGKAVVFKPPIASGSKGLRIIDARLDKEAQKFLLEDTPNSRDMSKDHFVEIFSRGEFPELIVQEFIEGPEECVDCLCHEGKLLLATVRSREDYRYGLSWQGELIRRPYLVEQAEEIVETFGMGLSWCVSMLFIGGKLIHINPRFSTLIYQPDLNLSYLAIKLALEEITEDEVRAKSELIHIGLRFRRFVDQVCFEKQQPVGQSWTATWRKGTATPPAQTEG